MPWITTESGKHINTDWFDKERQIEANKAEANEKNYQNRIDDVISKIDGLTEKKLKLGNIDNITPQSKKSLSEILADKPRNFNPYDSKLQKDSEVEVSKITTTQPYLDKKHLKHLAESLKSTKFEDLKDKDYESDTSIVLLQHGDEYTVYDGNHRVALANLLKLGKIKAKVVSV